ncbi:Protein CDC-25.1 [Aphelenchoides avenae]|nr:Protein CDC-25.1 [Aphelenchus avenae]
MPSAAFRSITGQTLTTEIKRLGWSAFAKKYIVVDCRYPYEYAGGHIKCAINVHDKSQLAPHFFPVHDRIPIFHCEFSHKRGPTMAEALRDFDRRVNLDRHLDGGPSVHYQEIYLLEGGYKAFFEQFRNHVSNVTLARGQQEAVGPLRAERIRGDFSDTAQLARYKNHLKRSVQASPKSRLRAVGRKIRGIAMRPLRFSTSPPSPVASKKMKPTTPAGLSGKTSARKSHEDTPKGTKGFMRPLTEWYPVRKQARTSAEARHKSSIHNHKPDKAEGYSKTPAGALKRYVSEPIVEHPVTSDDEDSFEASNPLPDMGRLSFD